MSDDPIRRDSTIAEVLDHRPRAARVFLDHAMACVGCAMAPFDTVDDAAASYGLRPDTLLAELRSAAREET